MIKSEVDKFIRDTVDDIVINMIVLNSLLNDNEVSPETKEYVSSVQQVVNYIYKDDNN